MEPTMVVVTVPAAEDDRFKSWRKQITGVDQSRQDGYAFLGFWKDAGRLCEVPVGTLFLVYDEKGSRANHIAEVGLMEATADGKLVKCSDDDGAISVRSRDWALLLRDRVAAHLRKQQTARRTHPDPGAGPDSLSAEEAALAQALAALPAARRALVLAVAEASQ